jgi:ferredoxin
VLSVVVFSILTFIFLDPYHLAPSAVIRILTALQAGPTLVEFMSGIHPGFAALLLVCLVTLLWGRVYCSTLCPLGTYQDIINRIPEWVSRKNKRRFRFQKPHSLVQYGIVVCSAIGIFFGSMMLVNLLEPYSNYGRSVQAVGNPLIVVLNNFAASTAIRLGSFGIFQMAFREFDAVAFFLPVLFLLFVGVLTYKKGRLFCTMLCPVGGILSLLSRASLYKISVVPDECKKCGLCEKVCKTRCIDAENQTVEFSACVGCMNCLDACPTDGIRYVLRKPKSKLTPPDLTEKKAPDDLDKSRRNVLQSFAVIPLMKILDLPKIAGDTSGCSSLAEHSPITPPGSLSMEHFTQYCTACHLCVTQCPSQILYPAGFEYGLRGLFQPKMNYSAGYCGYDCNLCGQICPTGAILPLEKAEKKLTQIGTAEFHRNDCIVITKGKDCGACSEHCPTKAVRMVPYENRFLPEVHPEYCIGCGACEHACPVRPERAIVVAAKTVHTAAEKPAQEAAPKSADQPLQEFPF